MIGTTVSKRTPTVIAAEINQINQQTGKILLTNAVEIGRRLKEAKDLVPYGAWGQWLQESVRYSKSTAANLMRLYQEYGPRMSAASAGESLPDFQPVGNLTYTQALILLDVPEEEREQFMADNDLGSMSKRELLQVVKESQSLQAEAQPQPQPQPQPHSQPQGTIQPLPESSQTVQENQGIEIIHVVKNKTRPSKVSITTVLSDKPGAGSGPVITPEDLVAIEAAEAKVIHCRQQIVTLFEEIQKALKELNCKDPERKEKSRQEAYKMLINLTKQLEVWPPIPRFLVTES
ncbi:DUF3102 domain-containing protein [Desulfosporosinus sp. PR]|uniref:DUF3102 domain-containing protein n=1 Tax=Candidatus Desulfosporosinus nitrosoreducens TaxID=3401928 RepID=UPI0027F1BA73|nr:DUF3102 domain-containing protein [Desulfosporosinus sp. PR]MDQ7093476.1 DUF3102 domain-containing protein [Desulfosporosinus sp. PR]